MLLIFLSASTVFVVQGESATFYFFGIAFFMALINRMFSSAFKFLLYFIVMYILSVISGGVIQVLISTFVLRGLSLGLAMTTLIKSADTSEIIASLRKMKLPNELIIPISVMIRFFPALKEDIKFIRFGMKTRDIRLIGKTPLAIYELYLVPLIMRMLKTAENLSAAAETRGISFEGKKTSYTLVKLTVADIIVMISLVSVYILIVFTHTIGGF